MSLLQTPDFGLLFDALPTPHLALAPDLTVAATNAAMATWLGQPAAHLLGRPAAEVLPLASEEPRWPQLLRDIQACPDEHTLTLLAPGGTLRRLTLSAVLAPDSGELRYLLARPAASDVAPGVRRQQEQFRFLSEFIPQLVWTTDAYGRHDYFNQRWRDYTGHAGVAAPEVAWISQLHETEQSAARERWLLALRTGAPYRGESRLRSHDGRYRWFLIQALPLHDTHGQLSQWLGTCTDIDDAKRVQQRLLAKDRQLQQILRQVPAHVATLFGPEHICSFATPNFLELLEGRLRVGWALGQTLPEFAEQGVLALLDAAYRTGQTSMHQAYPLAWNAPDGTARPRRYFDLTLQPLFNEHHQVQGVLFFAVEVTPRVLARRRNERLAAAVRRRDEQIRTMTEALPLISYIQAPGGRIVYVSPQWAAYTGTPATAARGGQGWRTLVHPDDQPQLATAFAGARREQRAWSTELRLRAADGQYRWHQARSLPMFDEQGRLNRWYGSLIDVHEHKALAEQLRQSEQQFRFLTDVVPLFTWTARPDGVLEFANRRFLEYSGLSASALPDGSWLEAIHPDDQAATRQLWAASLSTGADFQVQHRVRSCQGDYRWHLVRATAMRDEAGGILQWYGSSTDIHEQRALNDQLRYSEERFRLLTHSIPHIIWTATAQGTLDYLSPQWFRLTGQDPLDPTLLGADAGWLRAVHPDDLPLAKREIGNALTKRLAYTMHVRLRRRDGQYRWHLVRGVPELGPDGAVLRLFGSNTDIHDQYELQAELRRSEAEFRFLADSIPQLVWTLGPDGTPEFLNEGWLQYTGFGVEEVRQNGWGVLVPPAERDEAMQVMSDNISQGRAHEHENRLRRAADGQYRWHLHRARPMHDAEGRIIRWFGTSTDVDDYKRFQHELETRNAELMRINQDLDNFVYTASHDLKQPIDNMASIFQELARTAHYDDPDAPALVAMFEHSIDQLYGTIQELAALVQVQKRNLEVAPEEVRLERLTQEVLHSISEQIRAVGAVVETDFAAVPAVEFVRPNLQSVLYNLISNAVKYADPQRPPRIRVWTEHDADGRPVLGVQDNGLGIDLERHGKDLFQLFRRFHDHVPGSGTGLYLVQRLVQAHGGRIEVQSTLGEGTTFWVQLASRRTGRMLVADPT
ncbi:PAS domain-containing protein [Hymenobacter sp. CRA2]|uniref:PAS domain-containing protein n=1 Tax=Hymenobacter sp. CRA2 TaxID=1955620 RepID=UPI0009D14509|nr:PAS domain-containing protein [Hymenobacter sp. CRA2]OON67735.1 hypothetical protein B0919_16160 [Hymenobacter sp. CRA2]